ncbi:MAG: serine hydrolase [Sphingosinicella sp.]|nr:serine hydrolase [Sphingosinicella sp.]
MLLSSAAVAADADPYTRALAAGYKAQFVCSGVFSAGRTPEAIDRYELAGTQENVAPLLAGLEARIDETAKTVSVTFDPALPPRVAAWRPWLGCTGLPIGATAANLPTLSVSPPQFIRAPDWPYGDVGAEAKPKGNAKALAVAIDEAFTTSSTTGVVIVQRGRIVAERYAEGFGQHVPQRTWSAAKSMTGTLIGVAAHKGLIDPAKPAPVPEWQAPGDPRAAITTDNLLRMASGLHSDFAGNRTDAIYFGGTHVGENVPGQALEAKPGTRFRYANNDTLLAAYGLRAAIGDDAKSSAFPFTELFWKIGMTHTFAETDWRGNFILSSQVWSTARDFARLGLLYLNDGVWNGERLLPEGWVRYVSTPSGPQPAENDVGYGASFWLMNTRDDIPKDTFGAFGNRGQFIVIVPSRNIVIVRRGEDHAGTRFDIAGFVASVLKTLK